MTVEHDELRELRGDILDAMRDGFSGINKRLDALDEYSRDHESRLSAVETRCELTGSKGGLLRNPKTYAVGGIGSALAVIVMEFLSKWGAAVPK